MFIRAERERERDNSPQFCFFSIYITCIEIETKGDHLKEVPTAAAEARDEMMREKNTCSEINGASAKRRYNSSHLLCIYIFNIFEI